MPMSEEMKERLVFAMGRMGWKQRGRGATFVCTKTGKIKKFKRWIDVYDLVMKTKG